MPNDVSSPIERVLESFERLTADISSRFSYIPVDELPNAIEAALRHLVEALDVDRSTVFELAENEDAVRTLYFWARPGVAPMRTQDSESLRWYLGRLRDNEAVRFGDIERDLPPEAEVERTYARGVGMKSNLSIPVFIGGHMVCALAVGSFRHAREWPEPLVERVRLIAQIVAAALLRHRQELALRAGLGEIERLNRQLQAENVYLHEELKSSHHFDEIVGNSDALRLVLARVEQVAPTQSTVLLLGETGTGKDLLAHAIHERSPRRQRPLVGVNCAALPAGLIESELFGHEKGAYTGAVAQRLGRFEIADGGTLFLDEVADLPLELQGRLLRVLQEGEFERVGSSRTMRVDVRIIAATNQDLEAAVRDGRFRIDLYYRLSVFPVVAPPLRDRPEDIPPLVWFFVNRYQRRMGRHIERVPRAAMDAMQQYEWPGNVRELQNVVERALIRSTRDVLEIDDAFGRGRPVSTLRPADRTLGAAERAHIIAVLDECAWRINGPGGAAETLALHPNTLRFRMKKLGIARPTRPRGRRGKR
jgi:formate hydrogenlyase transcriptional activator